jgi:heme A synthase
MLSVLAVAAFCGIASFRLDMPRVVLASFALAAAVAGAGVWNSAGLLQIAAALALSLAVYHVCYLVAMLAWFSCIGAESEAAEAAYEPRRIEAASLRFDRLS